MKRLKYISMVMLISVIISLVLSSCFVEISDFFEAESDTKETIPPKPLEPTETGYGYESITSPELKELYRLIHENAKTMIKSTDIKVEQALTEYQMRMVLDAYIYDHPEVFWLDSKYLYMVDSEDETTIEICCTIEGEELLNAKKSFNSKIDEIITNAPQNATAYDVEMYVHDYLVDNCDYDDEAVDEVKMNAYSAYGAIVENKAVCSGYSKAFQILCNRLGVECISIAGESQGENHQWNAVKLDGIWYQVDVTWDDSKNGELSQYDYFNLTDEAMYNDHVAWELYSEVEDTYIDGDTYNVFVPECTSETYNYYNYSCVTITDIYNSDEMVDYIAKSAQNGKKCADFLIDKSLDYADTVDSLIYDGYMYEWIEKANKKNDYMPEINPECKVYKKDKINVLTIELTYMGES